MNLEDLDAELNRLWTKVASKSPEPFMEPFMAYSEMEALPSSGNAAMEALALVKRQYKEQKERWEKMLEAKEEAVQTLSQTLNRAEAEILELKRQAQRFDVRLVTEVSVLANKLEAAQGLMRMEEQRFAQEEKRLVETLERLAAENERLRKREKALLGELENSRNQRAKSLEETQKLAKDAERLEAGVQEARQALARTLSEFAAERQARDKAEQERDDARSRLEETKERLSRIEKIWEEERRQWQELFRREKSFHLP